MRLAFDCHQFCTFLFSIFRINFRLFRASFFNTRKLIFSVLLDRKIWCFISFLFMTHETSRIITSEISTTTFCSFKNTLTTTEMRLTRSEKKYKHAIGWLSKNAAKLSFMYSSTMYFLMQAETFCFSFHLSRFSLFYSGKYRTKETELGEN